MEVFLNGSDTQNIDWLKKMLTMVVITLESHLNNLNLSFLVCLDLPCANIPPLDGVDIA